MTQESNPGELILPALRAQMGQWSYYISVMKMSDIVERIRIVGEIHSGESLQDLLQRQLTDRATGIADYLITQNQRFFNSLVIGTYGGDPKWYEVSIKETPFSLQQEFPIQYEGILGFLILEGTERLFAIDGQHRVAGIREALDRNQGLRNEEVSVILVAGVTQDHRQDDPKGFERTRRLFTTLNRYAKPVGKRDIIALDEDDSVAIVTRLLVEGHQLFSGKISLGQGRSIHPSDQENLTSIVTLYDCLNVFLQEGSLPSWNRFKKYRPSDEKLKSLQEKAIQLWDTYCEFFPEISDFRESSPSEMAAAKYRHPEGGHLLFRPIGLIASVRVVRDLMDSRNLSVEDAVSQVAQVPMQLEHELWSGLLWNSSGKRMIPASDNKLAARKLMFYAAGGDLVHLRTDRESLKLELAGLLNKEEKEIFLIRFVEY